MSEKRPIWFAGVVAVLLALALAWGWRLHNAPTANPRATAGPQSRPEVAQTSTTTPESKGGPEPWFQSAAKDLAAAQTAAEKSLVLARLHTTLATISPNEASAAIRRFLDTKTDATTGQGFKIGGKGSLLEAPTLRTFLLDQLGVLDPAAAAAYARAILDNAGSPDEWAVALRNLANGDTSPEARALLATKTAELLRNESWQQNPSAGYLEAFDTAVYLGGTNQLPPLSDLVRRQDNPAVAHAAFLTLDRLVINQPAEVLSVLAQHPDWMQGREETRADYFARADVGDPAQRGLVEAYLLDPAQSPAELQKFAAIFPNANFFVSNNLLTDTVTPDRASLAGRDQAALAAVDQWLADGRFQGVTPSLLLMRQRLLEFTRQAGGPAR